ncbi:AAA family ATPase [Azotobacter sp. CWF10]
MEGKRRPLAGPSPEPLCVFSTIKLSGFKSFVDPTTLHLPTNMTGVVGPNGCGKSNIIDAVRWVMGESSASRLRGDSLTDVIFSGSNARKPVSQATVELIFDNSDHTISGEYASFNEISVKRTVSRDGTSNPLPQRHQVPSPRHHRPVPRHRPGPRSYSIIEQGMISQIIEARPEDLRVYLEEAAGISKYNASAARRPRPASATPARTWTGWATCAMRSASSWSTSSASRAGRAVPGPAGRAPGQGCRVEGPGVPRAGRSPVEAARRPVAGRDQAAAADRRPARRRGPHRDLARGAKRPPTR